MSMQKYTVKDVFKRIRNGLTVKNDANSGGLPITRIETISNGEIDIQRVGYSGIADGEKDDWFLEKGDVLFSHINSITHIGKCAIYEGAPEKLIHGMNLLAFRPDSEVLFPKYALYLLRSPAFKKQLAKSIKPAVNQASVAIADINKIEVDIPPLEEQKRIAAILDKADSLRRKRAQAIALADDFLRATFLDLFGDPVTNPKRWEVCSVGDVTTCIVPGRDKPKSFTGMTPWVTTKDLIHLGLTSNSIDGLGLDDDEIAGVKAKTVPSGAVLMTYVGDLGVLSITGSEMVINQQLHAFLCSHDVMNSFLMYALSFQKSYMQSMASSTTLPYMNKTICNSIPVFKPPLHLQKRFNGFFLKIQAMKKTLSVAADSGTDLMTACSNKYLDI